MNTDGQVLEINENFFKNKDSFSTSKKKKKVTLTEIEVWSKKEHLKLKM